MNHSVRLIIFTLLAMGLVAGGFALVYRMGVLALTLPGTSQSVAPSPSLDGQTNLGPSNSLEPIEFATQFLPPLQIIDDDGRLTGEAVETVKCAMSGMDREYNITMMPWADAQDAVKNGPKYNAFFAGSRNSSRDSYGVATVPLVTQTLNFYVRPGFNVDNPLTNPDARTAARYSAKFQTSKWRNLALEGYRISTKPHDVVSLLSMLERGLVDVGYEYDLFMKYAASELNVDLSKYQIYDAGQQSLRVYFAQGFLATEPAFLEDFNNAICLCTGVLHDACTIGR